MANPIHRESWKKPNGWNVRCEFIAAGGEAAKYGDRSVTDVRSVFREVAGHTASYSDGIPYGLADGESCRFVIDYNNCPDQMKAAVIAQASDMPAARFAAATENKYRTPKYLPQSVSGTYPRQPNLFLVWSDRGTSNGTVTGLSIAYGGTDWESAENDVPTDPYFPGPMDTSIGSGLTIDYTLTGGVITDVHVNQGGTGYRVGQQVKVEDFVVPGRFAYFTVTSVADSTWYLEFAGCQRLSPSTKYKAEPAGLVIELEAIGIHKIALESLTDLTTFTRQYIAGQTDSTTGGNHFNMARYSTGLGIFDWQYSYDGYERRMQMSDRNRFWHWHAPLGAIFGYLDAAFDEALEFFMMEGYQTPTTSSTNLAGLYPATTSKVKLMKQATGRYDVPGNVILGQTDGHLHDSTAEMTTIRFIFAVTDQNSTYTQPSSWKAGLFTYAEDGLRKDCDSAWDLMRKLAEQFYLKMTPYYEYTGGLFKAKWDQSDPYGTTLTASTIGYADTASDASFESNSETREAVKQHYLVKGDQNDTVEVTSYTKSGKKIEMDCIFDIRHRTEADDVQYSVTYRTGIIYSRYANLRGLFVLTNATPRVTLDDILRNTADIIYAVSPALTVSFLYAGSSSYFTFETPNPYAYTAIPTELNYILYKTPPDYTSSLSIAPFMQRIRDIQLDELAGFGMVATFLAYYFGTPGDITDPDTAIDYSSNNQTAYEMVRPLSTDTIARMLGQRIDITPHAALSTAISEKAYATEIEIDWTNRSSDSDFVKVKYLTRSVRFD